MAHRLLLLSIKIILCLSLLTRCLHAMQQVKQVTSLDAEGATPYVGEALRALRAEVGSLAFCVSSTSMRQLYSATSAKLISLPKLLHLMTYTVEAL